MKQLDDLVSEALDDPMMRPPEFQLLVDRAAERGAVSRQRARVGIGAFAVVVGVVASVAFWNSDRDGSQQVATGPEESATAGSEAPGASTAPANDDALSEPTGAPSELPGEIGVTSAGEVGVHETQRYSLGVTSASIVVWGGIDQLVGGTYVDFGSVRPLEGGWKPMAESPLAPRADAEVVGLDSGSFLFVGGFADAGRLSDGALYDPQANQWSAVALLDTSVGSPFIEAIAPTPSGAVAVVRWHETDVLADAANDSLGVEVVEYNESENSWRALSPAPADADDYLIDVDDEGVIVLGTRAALVTEGDSVRSASMALFSSESGTSWDSVADASELPELQALRATPTTIVGTTFDHELVAIDRSGGTVSIGSALLDPSVCRTSVEVVTVTGEVVAWNCTLDRILAGSVSEALGGDARSVEGVPLQPIASVALADRVVVAGSDPEDPTVIQVVVVSYLES